MEKHLPVVGKTRFCVTVEGLITYLSSVDERCYGFQTKLLFRVLVD